MKNLDTKKNKVTKKVPFINEREIWWCEFGSNSVGIEIQKKRPAIILRKFSKNHLFVVPLTKSPKSDLIAFQLDSVRFLSNKSFANISQAKAIDVTRLDRRMGKLSHRVFIALQKKSAEVFTSASGA
jgi:mRNA-degrading endonuclease toxin of MazEF toxin-antitoxin module